MTAPRILELIVGISIIVSSIFVLIYLFKDAMGDKDDYTDCEV